MIGLCKDDDDNKMFYFFPIIGGALLAYDTSSGTNFTSNSSQGFSFICFPEVPSSDIAGPLVFLLIVAIVSNVLLLLILFFEPRLHHPMYYFLAMLAMVDILLCTVTTPRVLLILWTEDKTITEAACFSQMFFITFWSAMESSIFLVMAYDRYVAICNPLHYPTIVTNKLVAKACVFTVVRNLVVALPPPLLASGLDYCASRQILHCFCENMSVEKLSCSDYTPSSIFGLVCFLLFGGTDVFLIVVSYILILRTVVIARSFSAACKAFRTCGSHLIVICIFYFTVASTIVSIRTIQELPHPVHVIFSILHHLLPPLLNPIVYGMLTKEIRHSVERMIGKIKIHP
ncbi:PREDICTED: olfactory receptor 56A4-like [Nanorana parkeri]|uniref:olfactory receptor 56A4-like n=1 Tax=Nanorana parkeri TaxID=125878 RepID=UPI000854F6DD|nr:PREDICTED: olfactory receptor 56A4-like [Nanorana parkeri]